MRKKKQGKLHTRKNATRTFPFHAKQRKIIVIMPRFRKGHFAIIFAPVVRKISKTRVKFDFLTLLQDLTA